MKTHPILFLLPFLALDLSADREGAPAQKKPDSRLTALLDRAFDKEQERIFKGTDVNKDGAISTKEFKGLYGEGGGEKWMALFEKQGGGGSLDLAGFQAVRRAIHLDGGGSPERRPSVENRFKYSKLGKQFRAYDKSGDGQVTLEEYGRMSEGRLNERGEKTFKDADKDGSGSLDKYEFLEMRLAPPQREGGGKSPEARDK